MHSSNSNVSSNNKTSWRDYFGQKELSKAIYESKHPEIKEEQVEESDGEEEEEE